jgi:hypothetical protein
MTSKHAPINIKEALETPVYLIQDLPFEFN